MIIAQHKEMTEIYQMLKGKTKIYLTGCSQCATTCKFGGEEELQKMTVAIEKEGKEVVGAIVLDPSCIFPRVKKDLRQASDINEAEVILSLACGDGTQTVAKAVNIPVYPANNTLFIGEVERVGHYKEVCGACGCCELWWTAGICPVTRCAKGLLNGPCGGSKDGKCEVDPEMDCAWVLIYEALKKRGELDCLYRIHMPRDNHKARRLVIK